MTWNDPRIGHRTDRHDIAIAEGNEPRSLLLLDEPTWQSVVERMWTFINKEGPMMLDTMCWTWEGGDAGHGTCYVSIWVDRPPCPEYPRGYRGRQNIRAQRIMYEVEHGRGSADGGDVEKRCHNARCINPAHLAFSRAEQSRLL